ncbi:MAG: type 1 glutamine amidotransferase domain-containing protein, partial [Myxococcales bacterium]|nr:type 1 glutamine amidotransferase domain-containing protein [Myxococcales bacterium]
MPRILVTASSHPELAGKPNGTYLPELTHALHVFEERALPYVIATPKGGALPGYGHDADALTRDMLARDDFAAAIAETRGLDAVDAAEFDAVFFPGGYGLLFDLVDDERVHTFVRAFHERGAPIAAVCHGPAALVRVRDADGRALIHGRRTSGFTREEEVAMDTLGHIPFVLEEALVDAGAIYEKRARWQPHVVVDGLWITGQNPASAAGVGEAL